MKTARQVTFLSGKEEEEEEEELGLSNPLNKVYRKLHAGLDIRY